MTAVVTPNRVEYLKHFFELIQTRDSSSEEIFVLNNVSWQEFDQLLEYLPEQRQTLLKYLKSELEIMAPSRNHELIKKRFGMLLECYFLEKEIDYIALGSTTFRKEKLKRGIEPDQCYYFGEEKEFPDLVFEVVITSGGINLLEIYRGLGVREVWFWKQEKISIFALENGDYSEVSQSLLLPDLSKEIIEKFLVSTESSFLKIAKAFKQEIC